MPESELRCTCPHCGGRFGLKDRRRIGKNIRCPKCQEPFRVEDADVGEAEEREPVRKKNSSATGTAARRRLPDAEDEEQDEDEDRPRKRKKRKAKSHALLWVLLLLGAGGVLLVAGGVVVVVLVLRSGDGTSLPSGWKEFESPAGRFRAALPAPWIERPRTMSSPVGEIRDFQYLNEAKGEEISYSISYADFSADQLQKVSLEQIINAGRDAVVQMYGGRVEVDKAIELEGHRGREFVVQVPNRGRFLMRYYIAGSRLYTLTLAGSKAAQDSREGRAFFGSFHFTDAKK